MILVTGGAGFVGSHIVDALAADGHAVRVLDSSLPAAHRRDPDYLNPAADYVQGDVADRDMLDGVDAVSHQAAMVGLGQNMMDHRRLCPPQRPGTAVLLRGLAADGFKGRLVLASSMVVYGEGCYKLPAARPLTPAPREVDDLRSRKFGPRRPDCWLELEPVAVVESSPLDPRSVYAATKVHQEHLCFAFSRRRACPSRRCATTRCMNPDA